MSIRPQKKVIKLTEIEFDKKKIEELEKDFNKIDITSWSPTQVAILEGASQMMASVLPMSIISCKGIILFAM